MRSIWTPSIPAVSKLSGKKFKRNTGRNLRLSISTIWLSSKQRLGSMNNMLGVRKVERVKISIWSMLQLQPVGLTPKIYQMLQFKKTAVRSESGQQRVL